jgi:hypothetical protein
MELIVELLIFIISGYKSPFLFPPTGGNGKRWRGQRERMDTMLQDKIDKRAEETARRKIFGNYYNNDGIESSLDGSIREWTKKMYGWNCFSSETEKALDVFLNSLLSSALQIETRDIENKLLP